MINCSTSPKSLYLLDINSTENQEYSEWTVVQFSDKDQ